MSNDLVKRLRSDLSLVESYEALRRAADEIERLRERLEIDDTAPEYDGIECRNETIRQQDARIERLLNELERERMCHAACGVIVKSNTPEALAKVRDIHPDYLSASVRDCIEAVEREIALRDERDEAREYASIYEIGMEEWKDVAERYRAALENPLFKGK